MRNTEKVLKDSYIQKLLAKIALDVYSGRTTIENASIEYGLPHWLILEATVKLVQCSYKLINSTEVNADYSELTTKTKSYNKQLFCFVHIPKTAGTTLSNYLEDMFPSDEVVGFYSNEMLEQHAMLNSLHNYQLIKGHINLSWMLSMGFDFSNTKFITFLRYPLQRQLSFFNHLMRAPDLIAYSDFMHWKPNEQCLSLSGLRQRNGYATLKNHLESAKESLEKFFFVGVQEHFSEGLSSLAKIMGNPILEELSEKRLNTSTKNSNNIRQDVIDEIMSNNWADIELHAYATDLFKRKFSKEAMADFSIHKFPDIQPQSKISYTMDQPMSGTGWYYREGVKAIAHGIWRWTGPETTSIVRFHVRPNTSYKLSIKVINTLSAEILVGLTVSVNDIPISYEKKNPELGVIMITGKIEKCAISKKQKPNLVLKLEVPKVVKFNDVDKTSNDERMCGLAITNIDIVPDLSA